MIDDTKLLLRTIGFDMWKKTSGRIARSDGEPYHEFVIAMTEDDLMGVYQSVRGILYDCDERPFTLEVRETLYLRGVKVNE